MCSLSDNLAAGGASENVGGGIANSGSLTITHSEIKTTRPPTGTAQGRGAGIADSVNGGGSLEISGSSITGNVVQGHGGLGGAIFFESIDPPDGTDDLHHEQHHREQQGPWDQRPGRGDLLRADHNTGSPQLPLILAQDTFSGNIADGGSDKAKGGALFYSPISNATGASH